MCVNRRRFYSIHHILHAHYTAISNIIITEHKFLQQKRKNLLTNAIRFDIIYRHTKRRHGQAVRQSSAKASFPSSNLGGASKQNDTPSGVSFLFLAKPLIAFELLRRIGAKFKFATKKKRLISVFSPG